MLSAGELPVAPHEAVPPAGVETHANMNTTAESGPGEPDGVQRAPNEFARAPKISPDMPLASGNTAGPIASATTAPDSMESPQRTLGQRLRAGREAKGWSAEETGSRLRLPLQIIQRIEAEQFEKIGYDIYLRGYLTSYARLVGVPTVLVDSMLRDRRQAPPPLVSSGTISHSRYLYQRYSVSALYLILTAVIIVPAVMLAMRASMEPNGSQLAALNPPASARSRSRSR